MTDALQPPLETNGAPNRVYRGEKMTLFVDMVYGLAIGTGFTEFPFDPHINWQATLIFMTTIWLGLQDWYEYHSSANEPGAVVPVHVQFISILNALLIHLFFKYASQPDMTRWLVCVRIFCLNNAVYNWLVEFRNHRALAGVAAALALIYFGCAVYWVPWIKQWLPDHHRIATLAVVLCIEIAWVVILAKFERLPDP